MSQPPGDDMLGRGLRLLTVLSRHSRGMGVSAVARAAELPVSSAHRLLARLVAEGFVSYDADTRRYALGVRVLELSRGFQRSSAGYSAAAGPVQRLAARTGLPVLTGVLDGAEILLVLTAEGTQHIQLRSAEGTRNPWYATSMGKLLAAGLAEEEREQLLAAKLVPVTPRTCTDADVLREELARVRERGWAEVDEENEIGVRSIAVPVPDPEGLRETPLTLSLGATVVLTPGSELRSLLPELRACADEVAARLR
ncbi:IclR family transcriptional regulator [Streptomyces xiaopingdaonensis]|uniref:IclR family transcriptional regulator n=1 Tax=Streptomyces xiaopingdaonensis TaxID=1565415 RepID=UPI0002D74338|nr:IclR family transcriptional regulator [Streptomyces xiaopingdaonensis]